MTVLPRWLDPLPDSEQQRAIDAWAIDELSISGSALMERAGAGLCDLVDELAPEGRVAIVCGKGNNGGDGLVTARMLRDRGREVEVLLLGDPEDLRGDARTNLERLPGPPPGRFDAAALTGVAAIVDAILGTGFSGEPREPARGAIDAINASADGTVVVACDVPSGVDASTGEVSGAAVRADATATFAAGKPGLWIAPGKEHAGTVRVVDIGIPARNPAQPDSRSLAQPNSRSLAQPDSRPPAEPTIGLITAAVTGEIPRRGRDSTKFAAGSLLVCGGSLGLTGAPCLASEAAMRAGAGYVTAFVPRSLNQIFELRLLEVMTVPLPDRDGSLESEGADVVLGRASRAGALILGPGLGREPGAVELARTLAAEVEVPLLLDADGLNAHAERLELLAGRQAGTVLTPHAGELGRLLGCESSEVGAHRLACARRAAAGANAIVVLKGDDTIVAAPDGRAGISRGGASALATAGTGDVLSGVIGAYLAKGMDPFAAACAGVFVHAQAGRLVARTIGPEGVIARDVIEALPRARGAGD